MHSSFVTKTCLANSFLHLYLLNHLRFFLTFLGGLVLAIFCSVLQIGRKILETVVWGWEQRYGNQAVDLPRYLSPKERSHRKHPYPDQQSTATWRWKRGQDGTMLGSWIQYTYLIFNSSKFLNDSCNFFLFACKAFLGKKVSLIGS